MEPTWVRAVYLHLMAFVGVIIIVFGVLGFALGVVHTAAPELASGNPFTSIATSLVDIAGTVANSASANGSDVPPSVKDGISSAKNELHRQARNHAINEILRGLFMALLGFAVYWYHIRKTDAEMRHSAIRFASLPGSAPVAPAASPSPPAPPAPGWPPAGPGAPGAPV